MFGSLRSAGSPGPWLVVMSLAVQTGIASTAQTPQVRTLTPIDQASSDPSFAAFRRTFVAALVAKDRKIVEGAIDPEILVSFGPDSGARAFREKWNLENPADPFWETMLGTVSLGGQFLSSDQFCAPYVSTAFPEDLDAADHYVVIVRDARLRTTPQETAPVAAVLSYSIVRRAESAGQSAGAPIWVPVLAGKTPGYLLAKDVRSPLDYRACFDRRGATWTLSAFVRGD